MWSSCVPPRWTSRSAGSCRSPCGPSGSSTSRALRSRTRTSCEPSERQPGGEGVALSLSEWGPRVGQGGRLVCNRAIRDGPSETGHRGPAIEDWQQLQLCARRPPRPARPHAGLTWERLPSCAPGSGCQNSHPHSSGVWGTLPYFRSSWSWSQGGKTRAVGKVSFKDKLTE